MLRKITPLLACALLVLAAGCATTPQQQPLAEDPELDRFARQVARDLEAHRWQDLLAAADPDHHRTQVVDHGMPEAQYVAELFGLHSVGNNIERGERPEWADLERIRIVELDALDTEAHPHSLEGTVTLDDGSTLRLRAQVAREDGSYVLTGGVG